MKTHNKAHQDDALMFMTPGSVWVRDNGRTSILLFMTNTSLPARVQAQFPPQAVFMDEEGNVLSRSVEDFLANRTFHNVNAEIETKVDQLLAYVSVEEDEENSEDSDDGEDKAEDDEDSGLEIVDDEEGGEDIPDSEVDAEADDEETEAEPAPLVMLEAPQDLAAVAREIENAIVGYRQEPILSHDLLAHILVIDPDLLDKVTTAQVLAAFDPESEILIPSFKIRGSDSITWDSFVGAYNQMTLKKDCIAIYLGCSMNVEKVESLSASVSDDLKAIEADLAQPMDGEAEAEAESVTEPAAVSEQAEPAPAAAVVVK